MYFFHSTFPARRQRSCVGHSATSKVSSVFFFFVFLGVHRFLFIHKVRKMGGYITKVYDSIIDSNSR